ncbi:MAG: hypothetical protein L0Z62_34995 [Gemmataceae bacterium]|nr:hypothetical protein [Gemmataceae bacterium]
MARWFLLGCVLGVLCSLTGCSKSEEPPVTVSGTVNLDGKPLDDGSVTLFGEGGAVPEGPFPVKGGKFEGQAKPGKKKVSIHAYRPGEKTKMGDEWIEAGNVNYLPDRFNTNSKITAEVTASGINPNKFDVTRE